MGTSRGEPPPISLPPVAPPLSPPPVPTPPLPPFPLCRHVAHLPADSSAPSAVLAPTLPSLLSTCNLDQQSGLLNAIGELTGLALVQMFSLLFDLEDYATTYRATRDAYLKAANELKLATGPYKAARDAYVAATATYTKSLYE